MRVNRPGREGPAGLGGSIKIPAVRALAETSTFRIFSRISSGTADVGLPNVSDLSPPGEDLETDVQLALREVLTGVTKRVTLREPQTCSTCVGSGRLRGQSCTTCHGSGTTTAAQDH